MLPKILLGAGVLAAFISMLLFANPKVNSGPRGDVVLWGTLPDTEMNVIVQQFNPKAKNYAVRYKYVSEVDFNQKLLEALASGTGPDMIMAPYQMILAQADRIYPYPINSLPEKTFKDTYVDGASVLFSSQGALGLPVSVEPMVLFYNRTLFSKHGVVNPPVYWDEVASVAPSLTIRQDGRFVESAIALGTPEVTNAKDIIMAIIAQLGQSPVVLVPDQLGKQFFNVQINQPVDTTSKVLPLASTARYYTQFGDSGQNTYTWAPSLGEASDVFVSEKLAMYIGYAGEYDTLKLRNPRGEFEMTFLPQTRGYNTFSTGMRMYAISTMKASKNASTAFAIESNFSDAGVAPSIARIIGAVPALRVYAGTQGLDPVIARSMLVARGWYDSHQKESTAYIRSMISDIINYRSGVNDAAATFEARLRDLYSK